MKKNFYFYLVFFAIASMQINRASSSFYDLLITPNNALVTVGTTPDKKNNQHFVIARFKSDGTLDTDFGTDGFTQTAIGTSSAASSIALQSDQKFVVGGYATTTSTQATLIRYSANGMLDTTFGIQGITHVPIGESSIIYHIETQPDDKIIICGSYTVDGTPNAFVARYTSNGLVDDTFGLRGIAYLHTNYARASAYSCTLQDDGKIITVVTCNEKVFMIFRHTIDGSLDTTFGTNGYIIHSLENPAKAYTINVLSNGNILVSGRSHGQAVVLQFNPDGSPIDTKHIAPLSIPNLHTTTHTVADNLLMLALSTSKKVLILPYRLDTPSSEQTQVSMLDLPMDNTTINAIKETADSSYISVGRQGDHAILICSKDTRLCPQFGDKGITLFPSEERIHPNYFFAYTTTNYTVIPNYTPIPLDGHILSDDWHHTIGDSTIACYVPGTYVVTYTATYHAEGINNAEVAIHMLQNNTEILGSASVNTISNNRMSTLTRTFIVQASKGDTLELQHEKNRHQGDIALQGYGAHNIGMTVTIHKARRKLIDEEPR